MRIFSSTIWVLPALLFNDVAADGPPTHEVANFTFEGYSFQGQKFGLNQSSVFDFDELKREGKDFSWTQTSEQVEVLQVDLMNNRSHAIASWCRLDENCNRKEGFSGSYTAHILPTMDAASLADRLRAQYYCGITRPEETLD